MTSPLCYDLLVIGGGINGAGIARDAAGRGLSVALFEQGDFAGATSSASTKLIHGGLRYLEYYEFRLVAEALTEREHVLDIAPHISWPLRFIMPHVKGLRPRWMIRVGLWLYDHLGSRVSLPASEAVALDKMAAASGLRPDIKRGFAYSDAWVDDARLVIFNLLSAEQKGAAIFARTRIVEACRRDGLWHCIAENTLTAERQTITARAVANAAGPWVAGVDRMLNPGLPLASEQAGVKLVRGSHIVVPRLFSGEHAYILQNNDKRIVFMVPYEGRYTLIGTTDVPQANMDGGVEVSSDEETYLLQAANAYLEKPVNAGDIVWRYAGVRPLFDDESDNPSEVTRDYTLIVHDSQDVPCISIYGGKITTYRRLAEAVLEKLKPWMAGHGGSWTSKEALPGGEFKRADRPLEIARLQGSFPQLDPAYLGRLFARHGLNAYAVLAGARTPEELGDDFGGGLRGCEVDYLVRHEWAHSADDILWRRTKCGLHMTEPQRNRFSRIFAQGGPRAPHMPAGPAKLAQPISIGG